jgi:lysophospholipase L1-like esterase
MVNFSFVGTEVGINAVGCGLMDMWVDQIYMGYVDIGGQGYRPCNHTTGLVGNLTHGTHTVSIAKRAEHGPCAIFGMMLGKGSTIAPPPPKPRRKIVCIGDSITAGFGNEPDGSQNGCQTYCTMLGRLFDADVHPIAQSGKGMVQNYGGGTKLTMPELFERTFSIYPTPTWDMSFVPDLVIINLDTNDYSTPAYQPSNEKFDAGYLAFHKRLQKSWPNAKFIFQSGPMACASCWGNPQGCGTRVQGVAESVGATYQFMDCNVYYIPPLTGKAGHPNILGHAKMANDTAPVIRKLMGWGGQELQFI